MSAADPGAKEMPGPTESGAGGVVMVAIGYQEPVAVAKELVSSRAWAMLLDSPTSGNGSPKALAGLASNYGINGAGQTVPWHQGLRGLPKPLDMGHSKATIARVVAQIEERTEGYVQRVVEVRS